MTSRFTRRIRMSLMLTCIALLAAASSAAAVGVTPASVTQSADPGQTIGPITKTVETPTIPPNPDIVFLIDQTTSMGPAINNVKAGLSSIMSTVVGAQPTAQFGVSIYRDQVDPAPIFSVLQGLTGNQAAVQSAVNSIGLTGGGTDAPEDFINGLWQIANGAISFRPDSTRFVVLVGDSSSHDPSAGHTLAQTVADLQADGIRVISVDVGPTPGEISNGLNAAGQATFLASQTGGNYLVGSASQAATLILSGLENQDLTVTHTLSNCSSHLTVSLTPPSITLQSGDNAVFTENITVSNAAPQGSTITCQVKFLIDGADQGITQTITINVNDVTPPVVNVVDQTVEATGPYGAVVNYVATATDNVDGSITPTCAPPSGSTFSIPATTSGVHTVTCTATDSSGNTGSDTGTITVQDTTPPALTLPADMIVEATGPGGAVVNYTASAFDIVDEDTPITCVPSSGSTFPVGIGSTTTTVTCTSTDMHGNTSQDTFDVTVQDTTPPSTSCTEGVNPAGTTPTAGRNPLAGQNPDGFFTLLATDIVDPNPQITLTDMGSGFVFGPFPSGTNIKYVQSASGPSISAGTGEVDWIIKGTGDAALVGTDASGNASVAVQCLVPQPPK